jgi:threonyl-tRNA synthetase
MATIAITVDGSARSVESDQRPTHIFAEDKTIVVARVNGELRDLWTELVDGDVVEGVSISSPDGLNVLRHSTAHVMAQAVQQVFAQTRLGIGPPIRDGFYYDFEPERPFTPEDLEKIESAMRKIVKDGQRFKRRVTTEADALKELSHEPYKCELIGLKSGATDETSVEVGGAELTIYDNLGRDGEPVWSDLCRGPHLPSTKHIPAFKLMRAAGAYWRGSEKNMEQRGHLRMNSMDILKCFLKPKNVIIENSDKNSTYSHFPKRSDLVSRYSTLRAESFDEQWKIIRGSVTKKRATSLSTHHI